MLDFPEFMKNPKNRIKSSSQYTANIEGYVFDGVDGSQMAFWTCKEDRKSEEHTHPYDEYIVCVQGCYMLHLPKKLVVLEPGNELFIPAQTPHSGECVAGTRTIHAFGGKRAEREI